MKKIVISTLLLSSFMFAGGGKGNTPKFNPIKDTKYKRIPYGVLASGCYKYIYITLTVTGEKASNTEFRNGKASVRAEFGNDYGPCRGRYSSQFEAHAQNITIGQASPTVHNAFFADNRYTKFNIKNESSVNVPLNSSAAKHAGGFAAWALVTIQSRLINIRAFATK